MPIWYPPEEIGQKELVGRRLLDNPDTTRSTDNDGRPLLKITDFHESRPGDDLSVDRLGDPNPNRDTLRAITCVADADATNRNPARAFNGWATIRVQNFRFTGWVAELAATPTRSEDGTIENHWHADVSRDGFREKAQAYTLAVTLQHLFELKGGYESPVRS